MELVTDEERNLIDSNDPCFSHHLRRRCPMQSSDQTCSLLEERRENYCYKSSRCWDLRSDWPHPELTLQSGMGMAFPFSVGPTAKGTGRRVGI